MRVTVKFLEGYPPKEINCNPEYTVSQLLDELFNYTGSKNLRLVLNSNGRHTYLEDYGKSLSECGINKDSDLTCLLKDQVMDANQTPIFNATHIPYDINKLAIGAFVCITIASYPTLRHLTSFVRPCAEVHPVVLGFGSIVLGLMAGYCVNKTNQERIG